MNPKTPNLHPKLINISDSELDFSLFNAVAIPVLAQEELQVKESKVLKLLSNFVKIDLNLELKKWSDFTGKPGEIIELPVIKDNLTRIYLVGVGSESIEDIRKASTSIGRKVKNTNSVLLSLLTS